jgi:hypothetical protein
MTAHLFRHWRATRHASARLRRLATVLAAVICGLLASAAAVPAAFARMEPDPGAGYVARASVPVHGSPWPGSSRAALKLRTSLSLSVMRRWVAEILIERI